MQIVNFKISRKTAACTRGDLLPYGAAVWNYAIRFLLGKYGTTIRIQVYFASKLLLSLNVPVREYYQFFLNIR